MKALIADGVLVSGVGDELRLSDAGRARVRRNAAAPGEEYVAQHGPITSRDVLDPDGDIQRLRGYDISGALRKIGALRDGRGAPWLNVSELNAAARLRVAWDSAQAGMVRGSDWSGPPQSSAARGPGNAQEAALAARCDASRRMNEALDALAPQLRRIVERVVLHEHGLEMIERTENWPSRSGKIALKLGLAQLAQHF
ncbi:hypothetical protein U91I_02477 [alpha proteobacterium U9-1i]|nr:hypothetical protein U91I_02477 [alpha proteobacterium U9-1i]